MRCDAKKKDAPPPRYSLPLPGKEEKRKREREKREKRGREKNPNAEPGANPEKVERERVQERERERKRKGVEGRESPGKHILVEFMLIQTEAGHTFVKINAAVVKINDLVPGGGGGRGAHFCHRVENTHAAAKAVPSGACKLHQRCSKNQNKLRRKKTHRLCLQKIEKKLLEIKIKKIR